MKKKIITILILLILIGGSSFGAYNVYSKEINIDTIYPGIKIEEFDIGKMSKEEALEYIRESRNNNINSKSMKLRYKDNIYDVELNDIGYTYNYENVVDKAYKLGREGKIIKRYKKIKSLKEDGYTLSLESEYKDSKIKDIVTRISEELYRDSVNAVFNFNGGNINVKEEVIGREVENDKLIKSIKSNVDKLDDIDGELEDIEIPVKFIKPKYTKEYYSKINGVIGTYTTSFKNSSPGRIKNIKLSASKFNGVLLHAGETLSFNNTTGPISQQTGYQQAPIILNGEFTPGTGGGVCQTSTTLYNAALMANLTIVERHPHSILPNYIEEGKDAAVAGDYLDLKFKNDHDFPIYITSKVSNNQVYLYVWGKKS